MNIYDKFCVIYDDDYPDCGGTGHEWFNTIDEALKFIDERIARKDSCGQNPSLDSYTLIQGREFPLKIAETVKKVDVDRSKTG